MAVYSMTGFGRAPMDLGGAHYAVEIRSLNHRHLDLRTRMPRALAAVEGAVRQQVSQALKRGRVELQILAPGGELDVPVAVEINDTLAQAVAQAHRSLAELTGAELTLTTEALAEVPGVLSPAGPSLDEAALSALVTGAVGLALERLVAMRKREGAALAALLNAHLDTVEAISGRLAREAPALAAAWRSRVESRIREMLQHHGLDMDEGRVLHEVAIFAEKADVAEEIGRLGAHVAQARALLAPDKEKDEAIGRRLDFLLQEMHRETNTIGSKVQSVEVSALVVDLKVELERLREQAANVE